MTDRLDPQLARRAERIARKTEHALTLAIVLELLAIARRIPLVGWMIILALLAFAALLVEWVWLHWLAYVVAALAVLVAARLVPGFVRGWRSPGRLHHR